MPEAVINGAGTRQAFDAADAFAEEQGAATVPAGGDAAAGITADERPAAGKMVRVLFVLRAVPPAADVAGVVDSASSAAKAARMAEIEQASEAEAAEAVMEAAPSPVP